MAAGAGQTGRDQGRQLPDLLRAQSPSASRGKAYLNGGPSHVDLYDMKPAAPICNR
jgi:hypothetical protein